eukprot:Rmarinus@m.16565
MTYSSFYVFVHRNTLDIVPASDTNAAFISFNRCTGDISMEAASVKEKRGKPEESTAVHAIFGVINLLSGPYVIFVTDRRAVSNAYGSPIYHVEKFKVMRVLREDSSLSDDQMEDESRMLSLLNAALEGHFYYAPDHDLTHSRQRIADLVANQHSGPPVDRADARFFWNSHLLKDFVSPELKKFVTPMMSGFVQETAGVVLGDTSVTMLLITRRSRWQQGTRFNMRGLDSCGRAANFVETEQVAVHPDGKITSHVQIRGSIPLLWRQYVTARYMPESELLTADVDSPSQAEACRSHFNDLKRHYGGVTAINLIDKKNKHGQLLLGHAYDHHVTAMKDPDVQYVWFDFHHECRNMKWHNLSKLIDIVNDTIESYGYFECSKDGFVTKRQSGVFRTNCMDNLDRTNVVQSLLARQSVLEQLSLDRRTHILESPYPSFEKVFKNCWADHANLVSSLYAGTGALKTDFTRTGKRTMQGLLSDGQNSCVRYFLNNFRDGQRQDALDLLLGVYIPHPDKPSPFPKTIYDRSLEYFIVRLVCLFLLFVYSLLIWGPKTALVGFERSSRQFLDTPRLTKQPDGPFHNTVVVPNHHTVAH